MTTPRFGPAGVIWATTLAFTAAGAALCVAQEIPRTVTAFRVCADPNNLPFSNRDEEGFENKIATLLARELHLPLRYTWLPQGRGFVRKTLKAGLCDVILGVPKEYGPTLTTQPYYRSTYVFVYRSDRDLRITSLDDTALRRLKIGVQVIGDDYHNTPPAQALASRGIIDNVIGFPIFGDYGEPNPERRIIHAVAAGTIDVAIVWGPLAGYFAAREAASLVVARLPTAPDSSGAQFAFDIAMGVRRPDALLASTLNRLLEEERPAIRAILESYGMPLVATDHEAAFGHD
jgi:quinoprotein dehydrogenase-associated probable ABC transporter substrate-binding protein